MGNTNRYEGGIGFGGDSREVQAQEYRTIPKSSLSQEQQATYVSAIQKLGGLNGTKWEAKITKYFNENDYVIDLQQEGLNQFDLKKIFNQYSDDQEDTFPEVEDESYRAYLNNRLVKTSRRYDSGLEGDRFNLSNDEQLEVESNYPYPTRLASESDYSNESVLSDWLLIEKNSKEHQLLIQGVKDKGVIPSLKLLNQMHPEIRNLKQKKKVSGEYLEFINATRELYGLAPYGSEPEELVLENPTVNQLEFDLNGQQEPTPVVETESGTTPPVEDVRSTGEEDTPTQEIPELQATDASTEDEGEDLPEVEELGKALDELVEEIATQESSSVDENSGALQQELDRLIVETDQRLSKESEPNKEKLERFKDNARQAISNFQQFVRDHSSPAYKSNSNVQEQYRQYENTAWDELYRLAHLLDGEIAVLPQDRDIQVSHPEVVDTKEYLEQIGYKFDEKGDIVGIMDKGKGVNIRLNRGRTIQNLINSKRPSHILYNKSFTLDDNDIYQGYIIEGLNLNTPDWFELVLRDNKFLEPVIVDETRQSTVSTTEAKQDPWSTESRGETEFEKIFTNSINTNKEAQGNNEIPDPWVEKASEINPEATEQDEGGETTPQVSLDDLRLAYAKAEEAWNRKRGDLELENAFESAREAYNIELERVLKLQVAEGQEANIHQMFKDEFLALRDRRIEQSQELQGKWEKRLNPIKEKFVNFVIKNKKFISRLNLAAGVAGGALALTGVGIPLAGGLAVARRMVSATLLGVSTGEGIRSLGEDADINSFWGKIKFQAVIPKLVQESLASNEDEFKQVSGDVLKERLGTLEAYYRLNGGRFINDDQQQAYEKVLTELARRVQENVIYVENNKYTSQSDWKEQKPQELTEGEIENLADENLSKRNILAKAIPFSRDREINKQYDLYDKEYEDWEKANPDRYASELLNTISDKRIVELDKFRKNRKTATIAALGVGLLAGGAVHIFDEVNKPDSVDLKDSPGAGTGGSGAPEAGADAPKQMPDTSPNGTRSSSVEALRQATTERVQDASNLSPKETVWGEIREWLGPNASEAQVQQVFENYANSSEGQKTIFNLAQQTEGGRALLSQWGIDNAGEMAGLSKEQLYEVSKYLGEGKLDGLTELSLDNLDALKQAEYVAQSPTVAPTIEPGSTEAPAPPTGTEDIVSKPPAPSSPPVTEAPIEPPSPVEAPVTPSEFTKDLSEILGKQNLTDIQAKEIVQSYFADDYGREAIYNSIINTGEGATVLSNGFGVNTLADFANITPDQMYEITNSIDSNELRKILNQTILARFEDAPDMVELTRGTNSLNVVQRYIANELGSLPYDSNLGKQVLDTYVQTDAGKMWIYDAIVNNPDVNNQNIQYFKEYLRFKDIKSPEEFLLKFNWSEFSGNRNIPTSGFWNQIRLPNGGTRLQPLSSFLKPSQMIGIKDAVRQVLTRQ